MKSTFLCISACPTHGTKAEYISPQDTRYRRLGKLDLNAVVTGLLATCPPSTIKLRNIDFCMLSAGAKQDWMRSDRYAVLSVRNGCPVRISAHVGGGTNPEYSKHVLAVFEKGQNYLQQLVTAPGYQGLYMLQLKDVAAAFKAEAPSPSIPQPQSPLATVSHYPAKQDLKMEQQGFDGSNDNSWIDKKPSAGQKMLSRPADDTDDGFDLPEAEAYFPL